MRMLEGGVYVGEGWEGRLVRAVSPVFVEHVRATGELDLHWEV